MIMKTDTHKHTHTYTHTHTHNPLNLTQKFPMWEISGKMGFPGSVEFNNWKFGMVDSPGRFS